ncbi:penicillin-binding protein 2 [Candidatus Parcubacteria bacterium]|nr:penicillin-binding protein 2 [Patescibacteria group bacterium]MBU4308978.1 penicillin-binding protein 2 [Patescibacteria group bacterium]MBU4431707.1 penicillin-binding protein 2 [Patescibacteria group bacterium]MBU4577338.1 penicillin-binding protein 2 [Patescibacteria group bacterium]MCG2697026.1 penicillin-binding protein 2 [Candidatus Parcubacteria bacterium]
MLNRKSARGGSALNGKKKNTDFVKKENRQKIVLAIVFLLAAGIIYRLFDLQVIKHDLYTKMASVQHQVYNKLMPMRGRIFLTDEKNTDFDGLYPLAINKEFATIFAVPADIVDDPATVAGKLYDILDKEDVEKEVAIFLSSDPLFAEATSTIEFVIASSSNYINPDLVAKLADAKYYNRLAEFKLIKKELEIEWRRDVILKKYTERLSKKNDLYELIKRKVDEDNLKLITDLNITGIEHVMESYRFYPSGNMSSHITGYVSNTDDGQVGHYGLEGFFNEELTGIAGFMRAERSANGKVVIVDDREVLQAQNGSDIILTIDRSIQYEACTRIKEGVIKYGARTGSVIIMEPKTGAILAMCSYPDFDPNNYNEAPDMNIFNNPSIFGGYEPGSIFKAYTLAAGLDQEKITPKTTYTDKGFVMVPGWSKPIKNSDFLKKGGHGVVDMDTVLEKSLNTGTIFVMNKIGAETFIDYVKKFGFGEKTGIELETESITNIVNLNRKTLRPIEVATATFGQGITATPLQLTAAYAAIANGGILMKPYLVKEIRTSSGEKSATQPTEVRRVISERAAMMLSGMLVNVIDKGHAKLAAVPGYYIAGKTGTAQVAGRGGYINRTMHSFAGFAPVDDPKFVALVMLDNPVNSPWADSSAAPTFQQVASFILNYYQVAKER